MYRYHVYYLAKNVPAGHVYARLDVGMSLQIIVHLRIQLPVQRDIGMRKRERQSETETETDREREI